MHHGPMGGEALYQCAGCQHDHGDVCCVSSSHRGNFGCQGEYVTILTWKKWVFVFVFLAFATNAFGQGMQVSRADCNDVPADAVLNNECIQTTDANGRLAGATYQYNGTAWIEKSRPTLVNAQTGTTYTIANSDSRKLVTLTNAGAIAVTLPQAGASSAFLSGWFAMVQNRGAGTVTITPTTSTIDGAATLALTTNQGVVIFSNGTNYFTMRGVGGSGVGTDDQTAAEVPYTPAVGANWGVDPNDVAEALDQAAARVTALEAAGALLPGTYLDDQIAVHNGTLFQAKSIPSCADTGGQHLNYTVATNTWSCGTSSTGGVSGLTVGNLHKAATTSTFTPSQVAEDADSINIGFPIEIGAVGTNSFALDTSGITGAKTWTVPNATETFVGKATTDTLTNKTIDAEATGNNITIPIYWDLDLVGVAGGTASHVWNDDPLGTACTPLAVIGTNRTTGVCTFPDSDGDFGRQITRHLPTGWTGSFDAEIWWKTTGTGNARFQIQTKCYADDEADDAAMNTASVVTAAAGTSARPNRTVMTGITTTGCAASELMRIRFFRNRTEASDTLNAALDVEKIVFIARVTH